MPDLNAKIDELIKTRKWDHLKDLLTTARENDLSNQKRIYNLVTTQNARAPFNRWADWAVTIIEENQTGFYN